MKRRELLTGMAGFAVSLTACGRGPRLNVFNWSDYVAPDTVSNFERESGVRVRYGTYESVQEMLAIVMSGNSGWDVAFPSADFVEPMRRLGLIAPLRHEWLPNLGTLDEAFQKPPWDPGLEWSVPYMHGSTGILYQKRLQPAPTRWADLWDSHLTGKITMLDDPTEVLGACLKKLGYSLNSEDPAELQAARNEAVRQKPLVRAYANAEVRDQVIAGEVLAAQAWAITAGQAIAEVPDRLAFAYPDEGFARFADTVVILRESRRQELAHRWINYLLRPEVAAEIVRTRRTLTCNQAAQALLPTAIRQDPALYPPGATLERGEWFRPMSGPALKLRDRMWIEIKSA
jgi:spermidine/putrescine transport system substrate-binding protein